MMRSLAFRHLLDDVPRLLTSLAGILFAVTLVLIQSGIYTGFLRSTSLLIEQSHADLWVASRNMSYFEVTLPIRYEAVTRVRRLAGVASAEPLAVRSVIWKSTSGDLDYARLIGFDPHGTSLQFTPALGNVSALDAIGKAAADASQLDALRANGPGASGSIRNLPAQIVAVTSGSQPIISPTFLFTSLSNAIAWSPLTLSELERNRSATSIEPDTPISYVLVRTQPAADVQALRAKIERVVPGTHVRTREEMMKQTRAYWVGRTNIGFILGLGAVLGVVVGGAVVAQILFASINDHYREYGTLKAIGVGDAGIYAGIVLQALTLAIAGFIPGLIVALLVARASAVAHGIAVSITPVTTIFALAVTMTMCLIAGCVAAQRALRIDAALVFAS